MHNSTHEGLIQEENREEHHSEHQADSKKVDLRQMMKTIIEHLPPPRGANHEGSHHAWNKERYTSRSSQRYHHCDRYRLV